MLADVQQYDAAFQGRASKPARPASSQIHSNSEGERKSKMGELMAMHKDHPTDMESHVANHLKARRQTTGLGPVPGGTPSVEPAGNQSLTPLL